ncbi:hypothetical protein BLNAU_8064 [Blattamonas nauphoetae]|uniref:Uncharacterized protein n=1 Tax=Blattamonas nauphoetae TaxID=2049346 RepID=A0ABQ9XZV6_9EUKA|nr:hypothetical protein BLNAU_8064 [Blattamonas nauphoetae]
MEPVTNEVGTSSAPTCSDLSFSNLLDLINCQPFLNWSGEKLESNSEKVTIFRSLVATVKFQPVLDVSLETKAVKFLKIVEPQNESSADGFLNSLAQITDESSTNFVESVVVLISSTSQAITTTSMKMLSQLIWHCSTKNLLLLVKADLIPELVITLNPLSLSFTEAVDIHTSLMTTIPTSLYLATPDSLVRLGIEDGYEQQAVHETSLGRIRQEPANASNCFFLLSDHKHCLCVIVVDSGIISCRHTLLLFRHHSRTAPTVRKWKLSMLTIGSGSSSLSNADAMPFPNGSTSTIIVGCSEDHKNRGTCSYTPSTRSSLSPLSKREEEGGTEAREAMRSKRCRTCIAPSSERSLCTPAPPHTDRSSASPSTGLDSICLGDGDCVLTLFPTVIVGCWLVVESMAVSPSTHHRPSSRLHKLDRNLHVTEQTGREHANADCQPSLRLRMRIASHPLRHTGTELWTQTIDNDDTTLRDRDL